MGRPIENHNGFEGRAMTKIRDKKKKKKVFHHPIHGYCEVKEGEDLVYHPLFGYKKLRKNNDKE